MRGMRWLLPVAIVAIICAVGLKYRAQRRTLQDQAPPTPAALPPQLNSSASKWQHHVTDHGKVLASIEADDFRQLKDSSKVDLTGLQMKLPSKDGKTYNLVRSAAASFFTADERLYSEGEVEMTLKIPNAGPGARKPISIKASGVTFDTTTGKAETDRPSSFVFPNGDGKATGATYDPTTHQLFMKADVELDWKAPKANAKLMKIEAGSLEYKEADNQILLRPWGRLTRDNTVVEGENPVIYLQDDGDGNKILRKIEAGKAHGSDSYPHRKLQYHADQLTVDFDDDGVAQKITGQGNAELISTSDTAETTVNAQHVEMAFDSDGHDSTLNHVDATGNAVASSKPLPAPGRQQLPETHTLRSEQIEMKMRTGGHEIETVATHQPGNLEFIPNGPEQRHRTLTGKDMLISYGPQNRIQSFHANDVRTTTDPTDAEKKRGRVTSKTTSREIQAQFDPKNSQITSMEQSGDFTFEQGDRKARAARATLDSGQNVIVLDTGARMSDTTGFTSADRIRMDERSGDMTAEGNVNSSRMPDKDKKKNSEMLSGDEPLQAQARRMDSSNRPNNRKVHYEGGVTMWQGANRIQAQTIDLDRDKRTLVADGNVVTNLWEQPKDDPKAPAKKNARPVLTVVTAPHLNYTEQDRLAVYTGGVLLTRPNMQVKSQELRAFLSESGNDSRLDKALSDGNVEIVQNSPGRTRTGTGDHSEYYAADQKVILYGGSPKMVDSKTGTTEGAKLTYFINDDSLLNNGSPAKPIDTRIKRK